MPLGRVWTSTLALVQEMRLLVGGQLEETIVEGEVRRRRIVGDDSGFLVAETGIEVKAIGQGSEGRGCDQGQLPAIDAQDLVQDWGSVDDGRGLGPIQLGDQAVLEELVDAFDPALSLRRMGGDEGDAQFL